MKVKAYNLYSNNDKALLRKFIGLFAKGPQADSIYRILSILDDNPNIIQNL